MPSNQTGRDLPMDGSTRLSIAMNWFPEMYDQLGVHVKPTCHLFMLPVLYVGMEDSFNAKPPAAKEPQS